MTRRTQGERTAATKKALVSAARALFASGGFAAVAADAIVREAGVSRGALYHQFGDKTHLFAAVFEAVEAELIERIEALVANGPAGDPIERMQQAASSWLDACQDPAIVRIALVDAPAVLGWARWREIGDRYGLALAQRLIAQAVAAGHVEAQPIEPLAYVLIGALRESALYIAAATDPIRARAEVGAAIRRIIASLASGAGAAGGRA